MVEYILMSRELLENFWKKEWGEPIPVTRKKKSVLNSWYPITHYIVATHNKKPIGFSGYTQLDGYALYGQSNVHSDYKKQGVYTRLGMERDAAVSGPKVAGLVSKDPTFPQEEYIAMQRSNHFIINPSKEEIIELFGEQYPEKRLQEFEEFYSNHPTGDWGIKKFDDGFSKTWIYLIKNYYPAGE